jgi:hypothetical protein
MPLETAAKIAPDALAWSGTLEMTPSNSGMLPGKRSLRVAAAEVHLEGGRHWHLSRPAEASSKYE